MENQKNKLVEEELLPNMLDQVYKEIRANEAERAIRAIDAELMKAGVPLEEDVDEEEEEIGASEAKADAGREFSEEDKELIRLGKIYRKRKKLHRYLVAAAAIVGVLAFGITSMGGPKKVFEKFNWTLAGREQTNVDSDNEDVVQMGDVKEDEVYEQIEDKYGFYPVKPIYRPEGVILLETIIGDEIQGINMLYGKEDEVKLTYVIRPNYKTSSIGKDIEDDFLEEYIEETEHAIIYMRKYLIDDSEERWSIQFEYKEVSYSMLIMDSNDAEVKKIVENLMFF